LAEKGEKKRDRKITKELSERENEVLELVAQGIGNKEISERIYKRSNSRGPQNAYS